MSLSREAESKTDETYGENIKKKTGRWKNENVKFVFDCYVVWLV